MANEQELPDDRKEKEEIIRNFRLMDDTFMSKVFEDKACAELLLRIILGRDDLTVQEAVTQYELKNIQDVPPSWISTLLTAPERNTTSRYSAATREQFRSVDSITAACWTATRLIPEITLRSSPRPM